ncbi:PAS domain S-box protein [Leptospira wolffii]|uniref:histidine kinase n=1 Tax=Leptospira wolffii TaxID=409998 RepID=A0A2M9ZG69_9LEPT|nr:ATP-binding protein [Leptospira wolffii]PJZ67374.1 PAS domain-containing sensor histidine kinase [Leptospira wolffii]TGK62368.1 PAS domain S-box protein [Leptospira wolffii]TGK70692.1 PAS domain S-box protein [Leptospira wolffii]TGK74248.1 PAS domain S-box protein [Leptospira wolffii]TGL32177.1 PAS domain S-box protein [Leptospira wolffii]
MDNSELIQLIEKAFFPAQEGILILEPGTYSILGSNPKAASILGYSREELAGLGLSQLLSRPDSIGNHGNGAEELGISLLWNLRKKDGVQLLADFTINVFSDAPKSPLIFHIYQRSEIREIELRLYYLQSILRTLRLLKLNLRSLRLSSETTLFQKICDTLKENPHYSLVWGFHRREDDSDQILIQSDLDSKWRKILESAWEERKHSSPFSTLLDGKEQFHIYEFGTRIYPEWEDTLLTKDFRRSLSLIIREEGKIIGGIEIISKENMAFDSGENYLYFEIVEDLLSSLQYLRIEKQKRETAKLLQFQGALLNSLEVPLLSTDDEGFITYANNNLSTLLGIPREEIVGVQVRDLLKLEPEAMDMILLGSRAETRITIRGRREVPFLLASSSLKDDYGNRIGTILLLLDITEQKKNEELIRASEMKLRNLFASMNNGIVILDPEGKVLEVAPILKFFLFQFLNVDVGDDFPKLFSEEEEKGIRAKLEECLRIQRAVYFDLSMALLGEEENYFSIKFLPLKKYQDLPVAAMLVFSDVTQTKLLDRQLYETAKFASIGEIAAGIAHEVNNPLQSSLLYLEDLIEHEDQDADERKKVYRRIEGAALRIRDLIKGLLDLGRRAPRKKELVSPYFILLRACELIEVSCKKNGIELKRVTSPELPQILVAWQEIEQVLINCLVNAVNAISEMEHKPAAPLIQVSARKELYLNGETVSFTIQDNGPGMSAEVVEKAFLPLYTTRRTKQGTGLGLTISQRIITDHGGSIYLESNPGQGTKVTIRVPVGKV